VVLAAGCGGGESPRSDADVVRAWADAVRTGDFAAADELFAVPSVIANGTPILRVTRRDQVAAFNRSLPCGAVLLGTQEITGGRLLATFRLTDGFRGRRCGPGTGDEARVSFFIRDGHIAEWLREPTGPPPGREPAGPPPGSTET